MLIGYVIVCALHVIIVLVTVYKDAADVTDYCVYLICVLLWFAICTTVRSTCCAESKEEMLE